MAPRAPYPMPDQDIEPPTKPIDVVEREYRQRSADREFPEKARHRIDCHAYESSVSANSEKPRGGVYPRNVAECTVLSLSAETKQENIVTRFRANTVGDYRAAVAHGNPGRDPLKAYGDTPEGEYTLINVRENVGGKALYINMKATGGPALLHAQRDNLESIDFHSAGSSHRVTNGCLGASDETMERVVNTLAGTSYGSLSERVAAANAKLRKEQVTLTLSRSLDKPILTLD